MSKPEILLRNGNLIISFDYNEKTKDAVKKMDGAFYRPDSKTWSVPLSAETVSDILQFAGEFEADIEEAAKAALKNVGESHVKMLALSSALTSDLKIPGLLVEPMPFQLAAVEYILTARRLIVGDTMGLGKTGESLSAVYLARLFPTVVVCPAPLKYNWANEIFKWLPDVTVTILTSTQTFTVKKINGKAHDSINPHNTLGASDFIILNYDILTPKLNRWICKKASQYEKHSFEVGNVVIEPAKSWKKDKRDFVKANFRKDKIDMAPSSNDILERLLNIDPVAVIGDELHYCKEPKSRRAQGMKQLCEGVEYVIGLTGTPILSRPSELISQLGIIRRLDDFGGWFNFVQRYCNYHRTRFGPDYTGATNLKELNQKLRSICYIRRTKEEALPQLPKKIRAEVVIDIDNMEDYKEAEENFIEWLSENARLDDKFKESIADLSESDQEAQTHLYRASKAAKARRAETMVRIGQLKQIAVRGKMNAAIEWIEDFLKSGEKIILFMTHIEIQQQLIKKYPKAARLIQPDSFKERQANVDRFQAGETNMIICSLAVGGVGHTLTAASNVAFLEQGWTPAEHDQAEDRAHRKGQESSVTCWYLLGRNTIDNDIKDLIDAKRKIVNAATDGETDEMQNTEILSDLISRLIK